ncbi:conserved hypothetical protein [Psychromonas ingrahamii 37]|uniref:DUF2057 domain-containing protein n=1 Tax=Psychromonas ingrahamii (strain DSM 17664 / CCUG 51855 / 37) TaxID=357804 RepID=A1SVR3_PSYIN|nr:DUF2057 domain-containing protein [Psychromonas ingrahamii]ABM03578.1 conserved hypothetical protein [Psychromonas ingrahamii 37]
MRFLVVLITFCVMSSSYAATLTAERNVEILAVDGQKYSNQILDTSDFTLPKGQHQIVVRYSNSFPKDGMLTSKPYIFNIQADNNTTIAAVEIFNSYEQAKKALETGITWRVTNQNNSVMIKDADILSGEGFLPYHDIEKLIAKYNKDEGIISSSTADNLAITAQGESSDYSNSAPIEQLIKVYNSASKADKKAFRIWLIEQDMK